MYTYIPTQNGFPLLTQSNSFTYRLLVTTAIPLLNHVRISFTMHKNIFYNAL